MPIKLIVSDLDDTFLNDESKIPQKNRESLDYIKSRGVDFAVCSGRSYISLDPFLAELGLKEPGNYGLAFQGAVVYKADTLEIIKAHYLRLTVMRRIMGILRSFPKIREIDILVYDKNSVVTAERDSDNFRGYYGFAKIPHRLVGSLDEIGDDVCKMLLVGRPPTLRELEGFVLPELPDGASMFFSKEHFLEFTDKKGTKGDGVRALAEILGITLDEVVTMGDSWNDLAMLAGFPNSVGVRTGVPEVIKQASYITKATNSEGILPEIIEKWGI
ncbi:MAG: Cof-type HAD-IIB family hydrolase [Clostridiales bacterium]|nr:Cof-type HAD-IIB family hydrolase [Clostridiales bacterium]